MSPRVRTALVVVPLFLAVLFFGGRFLFALLVAGIAAVGVAEYGRIVQPEAEPLAAIFVCVWSVVVVLGFLARSPVVPGVLLAVGALLYLGGWIVGSGPSPRTLPGWGGAAGAWMLIAFFLGHAVWVRSHGISPVCFVAVVVWAGDTAAFYAGTAFGSRPLAPRVSPKKSVEGAVASLVAAGAAALAAGVLLPLPHSAVASLAVGVVLNGVAQMGDLTESLLKRCAGVKDSGTLFPGHGGVLDRIDGFLLVLPLYVAFLTLSGA